MIGRRSALVLAATALPGCGGQAGAPATRPGPTSLPYRVVESYSVSPYPDGAGADPAAELVAGSTAAYRKAWQSWAPDTTPELAAPELKPGERALLVSGGPPADTVTVLSVTLGNVDEIVVQAQLDVSGPDCTQIAEVSSPVLLLAVPEEEIQQRTSARLDTQTRTTDC